MTTSGDKLKKIEMLRLFVRRLIDFIFTFENKKGDVLDLWLRHANNFSCSPQEFYAKVEHRLADSKFPGVEISRVRFAEGGLLSDQRIYLRLMRERLCIDICVAPFGSVFFFSCRTVYVPALVRLWHIVVIGGFLGLVDSLLAKPMGDGYAAIATIGLVFAGATVLQNAASGDYSDLDALLLKMPVISTIYEDWFRVDTYYRQDTRSLYMHLLPKLIEELAEETCATKGIRLEPQIQPVAPIVDLNKTHPPDKKPQ